MKKNIHFQPFLNWMIHLRSRNQWFGRTVINSNERFAYEEAQHIIETSSGAIPQDISIRGNAVY